MSAPTNVVIKTVFGEDTRRISTKRTVNLSDLKQLFSQRYGVSAPLALKWMDEDGDAVTIADDSDLEEALASGNKIKMILATDGAAPSEVSTSAVSQKESPEPAQGVRGALLQLSTALELQMPPQMADKIAAKLTAGAPMIQQYAAEMKRCRVGPSPACNVPAAPQPDQPEPVKHWGVFCNATGTYPIQGIRYKKRGKDFDLCEAAFVKLSAAEQAQYERIETPTRSEESLEEVHLAVARDAVKMPMCSFRRRRRSPCRTVNSTGGCALGGVFGAMRRVAQEARDTEKAQEKGKKMAVACRRTTALVGGVFQKYVKMCSMLAADKAAGAAPKRAAAEKPTTPTEHAHADQKEAEVETTAAVKVTAGANEVTAIADDPTVAADESTSLLMSMGFSAEQAVRALVAGNGSLEQAADWLFVQAPPKHAVTSQPEEQFTEMLPAWAPLVTDLAEMGFEEAHAMEALRDASGDLKGAVRVLLARKRNY